MDRKSEYIILYEELKQHIRNGEIPPGNKLPSERGFMETYGISRTTVRSALALLEREKFVVKQPGVGCIVLSPAEQERKEKLRIGICRILLQFLPVMIFKRRPRQRWITARRPVML